MSGLQTTLLVLSRTEGGRTMLSTSFTPLQEKLLVAYLRLFPKIAVLADPVKSRTQMMDRLLTTVTKEAVQRSLATFLPPTFEGFGHAPVTTQALLCSHDPAGNLVGGCTLFMKSFPGTVEPSRTEIWNHLQNPQYAMAAVSGDYETYLYLAAMEATRAYFKGLDGTDSVAKIVTGMSPQAFPQQDFYDRLLVLGRSGFTVPSGRFTVILASGTPVYETFENYAFISRFFRGGPAKDAFMDRRTGKSYTLSEMRKTYPLLYPYWLDATTLTAEDGILKPIGLATNPLSDYDSVRIQKEMARIGKPALPRPLSELYKAPVDQTYGCLSHSAYQRDSAENALEMFRLPADVEVLIFNSPGYSTYSEAVKQNWNAVAKYFRHVPIQALKMVYPGFRETGPGRLSVDPMRFLDATSGGLLTTVTHSHNILSKIQVHAYAGGDACPNLYHMSILGPRTKDFVATIFGLYHFLNVPNYKDLMFKSPEKTYYADSDLTVGALDRFPLIGSPDQRMRIYPTRGELESEFADGSGEVLFDMTTSEMVDLLKQRAVTAAPKRLVIFSCGDLRMNTTEDVAVNETLKRIADLRKTYAIQLSSDAMYRRHIYRMGEGLFDLFGTLPASFSLASMPAPTASIRRGSRGTRKTQGTRGTRGTRRARWS